MLMRVLPIQFTTEMYVQKEVPGVTKLSVRLKAIFENVTLEQYPDVWCRRFPNTCLLEEFLGALESI